MMQQMNHKTFQTALKSEHQINSKSAKTRLVPVAIDNAQHIVVSSLSLLQLFNSLA